MFGQLIGALGGPAVPAVSYPTLTLANPVYASPGKFGSADQALSAGSGTISSIVVPDPGTCGIGFWMASVGTSYGTDFQAQGFFSFGRAWAGAEVTFDGNGQGLSNANAPSTASGVPNWNDGVYHWFYFRRNATSGNAGAWWMDGTLVLDNINVTNQSNNLVINFDMGELSGGNWLDELVIFKGVDDAGRSAVPTGPHSSADPNIIGLYKLDGSAAGG